jgi:hypothetical protein
LTKEFDIHIRLQEENADDQAEYLAVAWNSLRWVGSSFYMNMMFYIAIVLDLFAGWLLTTHPI